LIPPRSSSARSANPTLRPFRVCKSHPRFPGTLGQRIPPGQSGPAIPPGQSVSGPAIPPGQSVSGPAIPLRRCSVGGVSTLFFIQHHLLITVHSGSNTPATRSTIVHILPPDGLGKGTMESPLIFCDQHFSNGFRIQSKVTMGSS